MTKWKVYQSDRTHKNQQRSETTTLKLVLNLLFGKFDQIVTINRMKDE